MLSMRNIGNIGRTYRHLNRYRQILGVFLKYGFGDLVERLRIGAYLEIGMRVLLRKKPSTAEKLSRAERLRMALAELGTTYIKLGQILSTRPDLIPMEFIQELSRLQDKVPPIHFDAIRAVVVSELGCPLEEAFASFEPVSIASASIGQVHRAVLKTGEPVAVKVQRPGIRKTIEVDLEIMRHLATLVERHIPELALHRPVKVVEEFARTLEKEIDYSTEAGHMERFARQFEGEPTVYVPRVYPETSTGRVLTMEFIDGIKVSDVEALKQAGMDLKEINRRGANLFLQQIFEHGFFHADPHPGNIFVLPGEVLCLLDFGMAASVDQKTRENFVDLIDSVASQEPSITTQILLKITDWDREPEIRLLEREVADFLGQHVYKPLKDIRIGKMLQEMLRLVARHHLRIPPDMFLMIKALSAIEGVALMLDPDFDMIARIAPYIAKAKMKRLQPGRVGRDMLRAGSDLLEFAKKFPVEMLDIVRLIRREKLSIGFEHRGLETMLATHDQISNRLAFSIIIAALIIGSALIVVSQIPPLIFGISLIGIILFFAAAIMGIWLLVAILKKGSL
jgi:ubiquinone biosynthesis protein